MSKIESSVKNRKSKVIKRSKVEIAVKSDKNVENRKFGSKWKFQSKAKKKVEKRKCILK